MVTLASSHHLNKALIIRLRWSSAKTNTTQGVSRRTLQRQFEYITDSMMPKNLVEVLAVSAEYDNTKKSKSPNITLITFMSFGSGTSPCRKLRL